MSNTQLVLEIITYGLTLWLGLYLLARNIRSLRLRYAGLGIVAYALNLLTSLLVHYASPPLSTILARIHWPLLFLPAFFWLIAIIYLLPKELDIPRKFSSFWQQSFLFVAVPFYLLSAGTNLIFDFSQEVPQPGPAYLIFVGAVILPLVVALGVIGRAYWSQEASQRRFGLLIVVTLFVTLGSGLMLYPLVWLPRNWLLLGLSFDFVVLGLAIALFDAFDEGETFLPDFFYSFDFSFFAALLFGGLVGLTMSFGTGINFPMVALLLATVSVAIATQTFANHIQTTVDRIALKAFPTLQRDRAELRATVTALQKIDQNPAFAEFDEVKFIKLTRRALSTMGDLPRLATSPLTRLPLIDRRLADRNARDDTLERATELKSLLAESICRLKPQGKGEFGTSEEWRHFNALYFPYVAGLRPYSRRAEHNGLTSHEKDALDWFRTYIPERTLYNWQNAAAQLIAKDLREKLQTTEDR
ncbi:MAG: hypothetical protein AAF485_32795 [Chloroflexota bacterium]